MPSSPTTTERTIATSQAYFEAASRVMPGGVSSPVRAFKNVGGTPLFIQRAKGAKIWDVDGNDYIDYVGSWGPMILGHADPDVIKTVQQLAENGTSFGAPCQLETQLAEMIVDAVPSIEQVRFVSTGTEAVMSAIRLARAFTGRRKLIKFIGCYHGHTDALLVKAGSGASTHGSPDSAGVPEQLTHDTLLAHFNDLDAVSAICKAYGNELAAILVEPVAGNMGCIPPEPGFLEGLRKLANETGAMLIFDEVMTGFRVAYGGAQAHYGVTPDITTLGKIVGGGLPAAAYGASKTIMSCVAPLGAMYQAGTLSGNPLAMGAGIKTLEKLQQPGVYDQLDATTQTLVSGIAQRAKKYGIALTTTQVGAMFSLFFQAGPVQHYDHVLASNKDHFNQLFHRLLSLGVYLAPSAFEAGFVSLAHDERTIQTTLDAFDVALSELSA